MPEPSQPSLAGRAALAVALMIGFYALALTVAALLLAVPWLGWKLHLTNVLFGKLALFSLAAGAIVLWSIVPRPDRFEPPGPRLLPQEHPALFRELSAIAEATGQPMPHDVHLAPDVNAFVAQRGGVMGFGSRPVMGLGLPLLQLLTVAELRAVIAHEFGHFHGGDTRLGPWVYKTRAAIARTITGLSSRDESAKSDRFAVVRVPFEAYGNLFLRLTHAVSRRQELAADALAARVAGVAAAAHGLRVTHAAAPAYGYYWQTEIAPLVDLGVLPPVAEGLARFVRVDGVSSRMRESVEQEIRDAEQDPHDTHPPLRERLAALGPAALAGGERDDGPSAITLLADVARLERALLVHVGGEAAASLRPVRWEEVPDSVLAPLYRGAAAAGREALGDRTVDRLPELAGRVLEFEREVGGTRERLDEEGRRGRGTWHLAAALADALARSGWALESEPGQPILLRRGECRIEPFAETAALVAGGTTAEEWQARCERWGTTGLRLSPP